jgi:hypothetical protein
LLAGVLGFSYVYVGRLGVGLALLAGAYAAAAILVWTRLMFTATGFYAFVASVLLVLAIQLVHPALIAARAKFMAPKPYGALLEEPYLRTSDPDAVPPSVGPLVLGENQVFVLGDYREFSRDSRYFGPIHGDQLHGRVELRYFSKSRDGIRWDRFPATLGN